MTGRRHPTRAWLLALALSGPGAGSSTAAEAPVFESELHRFQVITVSRGLEHPWGLAFLPDGAMLVTERPGRLRLIRDGVLDPAPVPGTPEVYAAGQGGLLDVALHPDFATNRWVYLSYAGRGRDGAGTEVARGRFVARKQYCVFYRKNQNLIIQFSTIDIFKFFPQYWDQFTSIIAFKA
jgi:glucose/arabinose dehydrogenase